MVLFFSAIVPDYEAACLPRSLLISQLASDLADVSQDNVSNLPASFSSLFPCATNGFSFEGLAFTRPCD